MKINISFPFPFYCEIYSRFFAFSHVLSATLEAQRFSGLYVCFTVQLSMFPAICIAFFLLFCCSRVKQLD